MKPLKHAIWGVLILLTAGQAFALSRDWSQTTDLDVTRCFETAKIKVDCGEPKADYKDIHLSATDRAGERFNYSYMRALVSLMCTGHVAKIRKILKGTKYACITGFGESQIREGEVDAHWVALETTKGQALRNSIYR